MTTIVQSNWVTDVEGTWSTAADWNPNVVPTLGGGNEYWVTIGGASTAGTNDFTVTSSTNVRVGVLYVNVNATLDIAAGFFTDGSKVETLSVCYNYGAIDIAAHATMMMYQIAGGSSANSSELFNLGALNLAGALWIAAPFFDLEGAGTVTLAGGSIVAVNAGKLAEFRNDGNTIAGSGLIGAGTAMDLVNGPLGTIDANAAKVLVINTGANVIENAGTIETTGAGGLTVKSSMRLDGELDAAGTGALTLINAKVGGGGNVDVSAGGSIVLNQGEIVTNIISIAANGKLKTTVGNVTGVGTNGAYAGDVLATGDIEDFGAILVANHSTLNVNGSIFGDGAIRINGATGPTELEIFGGLSLFETGGLYLSASLDDAIVSNGRGATLSDYGDIFGAGTIGDSWLQLSNLGGMIDADLKVGLTIVGDASAVAAGSAGEDYNDGIIETIGKGGLTMSGGTLNNAGTLEASGLGALTLNSFVLDHGGGAVKTLGLGSIILDANSKIYNQGQVTISAAGSISTTAGDTADAILDAVFDSGKINVVGNSSLTVDGIWRDTGSVNLQGTSASATIVVNAGSAWQLLDNGIVHLNGPDSAIVSGGAGAILYNKSETLIGSGSIGDVNTTIENGAGGVIDAKGPSGLVLNATPYNSTTFATYIYNAGTIESNSVGGLTIESAIYNPGELIANTGGDIVARDAVLGVGAATINGTGSIEFGAAVDNSITFAGSAAGSVIFDQSSQFVGTLAGWSAGDSVDLRDFAYSAGNTEIDAATSGFGVLQGSMIVTNGTSDSAALHLMGNYGAANLAANNLAFHFSSDGHEIGATGSDGTLIKLVSTA